MQTLTIGIIGYGSFGKFLTGLFADAADIQVRVCDIGNISVPAALQSDMATVSRSDIVVLAIPLEAYATVMSQLQSLLSPETLLVDVCSVKERPAELFDRYFANHPNVLLTHPLFGPRSATNGLEGHQLIVTRAQGQRAEQVVAYCRDVLRLKVLHHTAHKHDQAMAQIHALTFFVARALRNLELAPVMYQTPSYAMIEDLVAFDKTHSQQLFDTIELGNPYADEVIQSFISAADQLADDIKTSPQRAIYKD